ncbi:MAG: hypothetical protein J07HX64_01595 [halophilic archaeon J07HX64]|nr:MAG: hypothetical protein J07HX64_01595 [halophilic archaeon J07HX64]
MTADSEASADETETTDSDEAETPELPDGLRLYGDVVAVERVPATEVPDTFPVAVWTDEALVLEFEFQRYDDRARTYFSLPETDPDDRLATLLDVQGVTEPEELAGGRVLLDIEDGYPTPVSREGGRRGDHRALYGVFLGVFPSFLVALGSFFGFADALFSMAYLGVYVVCTFLILPVSVYVDALYLRSTTDWQGGPLRWALLSVVPALYVLVVPYYLITRENARPLAVDDASVS